MTNKCLCLLSHHAQAIKALWHAHPETCIDVSSADIIQFAIFFATTRQKLTPGLDYDKWKTLLTAFEWGRPDEEECLTDWTFNLPGFELEKGGYSHFLYDHPNRCVFSGQEIKQKMMDRNGFTKCKYHTNFSFHCLHSHLMNNCFLLVTS